MGSKSTQSPTQPRSRLSRLFNLTKKFDGKVSVEEDSGTVVPTKRWTQFLRPLARKAAALAEVGGSVAEVAPIVGSSVKGALDAVAKVLTILEVRGKQSAEYLP